MPAGDAYLFDELREGDQMELLELENTAKGWRAKRLMPVAEPIAQPPTST